MALNPCPLCYSLGSLQILPDALQRVFYQHDDLERLEVVLYLPRDDEESKGHLFRPLVSGFGIKQGLANVIHWLLNGPSS